MSWGVRWCRSEEIHCFQEKRPIKKEEEKRKEGSCCLPDVDPCSSCTPTTISGETKFVGPEELKGWNSARSESLLIWIGHTHLNDLSWLCPIGCPKKTLIAQCPSKKLRPGHAHRDGSLFCSSIRTLHWPTVRLNSPQWNLRKLLMFAIPPSLT